MLIIIIVWLLVLYAAAPVNYLSLVSVIGHAPRGILLTLSPLAEPVSIWDGQVLLSPSTIPGFAILLFLYVLLSLSEGEGNEGAIKLSLLLGSGLTLVSQTFSITIISIEIQSYCTYLLLPAPFGASTPYGSIAYFLFGSIGTLCMLSAWGLSSRAELGGYVSSLSSLAVKLMAVGVGLKLGLAPFHFWLCNTYNELKLASIAWISTLPVVPLFMVMSSYHSEGLVWLLAGVSVVMGGVGAGLEARTLGFLALSGTANLGFALLSKGLDTSFLVSYIAFYAVSTIILIKLFSAWHRTARISPILGEIKFGISSFENLGLTIILLSLSGLPPLAGFYAKVLVVVPVIMAGGEAFVTLLLMASLFATVSYIRLALLSLAYPGTGGRGAVGEEKELGKAIVIGVILTLTAFSALNPLLSLWPI